MEITTFRLTEHPLTESCVSIQNKQIILRRTETCPHLQAFVCTLCVSDCFCCSIFVKAGLRVCEVSFGK